MATACAPAHAPSLSATWRWAAPRPAYVGAPSGDGDDVVATYGHSVLVLVRHGALAWQTTLIGLRDVAPAIEPDRIVAATDDGVAAVARADGHLLWERSVGDRASAPVVHRGHTIVTTWDGRLVDIDHWTLPLPGPALGPPAAAAGVVVAAWDTGVVAADVATGVVLWRHSFAGDGTSAPAARRGLAVVVGGDRRAHAFDLRSGRERWSIATAGAGSPEAPPAFGPAGIALADRLGHVTVVDRRGRRRWSASGAGAVVRGGPAWAGAAVVLPLDDGRLFVAARRGHRTLDPPGRISGVTSGPADGVVFATREAATNGLEYARINPG